MQRMWKEKISFVYKKASELYNEIIPFLKGKYIDKYNNFSVAKTKKIDSKYKPKNLFLRNYDHGD